jgi:predicted DNA-binding transcriptional regulator AlpA
VKIGDLSDLPPTLDGRQVAELLGCSYWALLEMVKRDEAPVPPIRLGHRLRWATAPVLRLLGLDSEGLPQEAGEVVPIRPDREVAR